MFFEARDANNGASSLRRGRLRDIQSDVAVMTIDDYIRNGSISSALSQSMRKARRFVCSAVPVSCGRPSRPRLCSSSWIRETG